MDCHRPTVQVVAASIRLYTPKGTLRPMAPCLSNGLFRGWALGARDNNPNSVLSGCVIPSQPTPSVSECRGTGSGLGLESQLSPGMPPPGRLAEKLESHIGVEPPTVKTLTTDLNILDIMLAKQAGRPKLD